MRQFWMLKQFCKKPHHVNKSVSRNANIYYWANRISRIVKNGSRLTMDGQFLSRDITIYFKNMRSEWEKKIQ